LNRKIVQGVGFCHLCDFAARRLPADLAEVVIPVQGVNPAASPAVVIGVPCAARLRIEAAILAVTSWRSPPLWNHHFRFGDRDRHGSVVLPARSRCLHLMSDEFGDDLALARQHRFGQVAAAVLPPTDPCDQPQSYRTGEFLQSRRFEYGLRMRKGCDG
jgi:hypothetical protein